MMGLITSSVCFVSGVSNVGHTVVHSDFFDTIKVKPSSSWDLDQIKAAAQEKKLNLRYFDDGTVSLLIAATLLLIIRLK